MGDFGLTSTGFVAKTEEDILASMEAAQLATVDPALNQDATEFLGQANGIVASELGEAWAALDGVYAGLDPNAAEDAQLDTGAGITGTNREPATYSLVSLSCGLSAAFAADAGTMTASVDGHSDVTFVNRDAVGPIASDGTYSITFRASVPGPVVANSGTLTVIAAALTGWNSVTNPSDAARGQNIESDTALRTRRIVELARSGSCTAPALQAALEDPDTVPGVLAALVLENDGDVVDGNGLPSHSMQAIVWDGVFSAADNQTIANTVWANKPSGTQTTGNVTESVIDFDGPHDVSFSRATQRPIGMSFTVLTDPTKFPVDGVTQIQDAIVTASLDPTRQSIGDDVVGLFYKSLALMIPGVRNASSFAIGFVGSSWSAGGDEALIAIGPTEIATFDTSDIAITVIS